LTIGIEAFAALIPKATHERRLHTWDEGADHLRRACAKETLVDLPVAIIIRTVARFNLGDVSITRRPSPIEAIDKPRTALRRAWQREPFVRLPVAIVIERVAILDEFERRTISARILRRTFVGVSVAIVVDAVAYLLAARRLARSRRDRALVAMDDHLTGEALGGGAWLDLIDR